MNSRVRIVKRNEAHEPKQPAELSPTQAVRNREMVAVVKSWIDEFKLRSRQQPRIALPLPNKA